MRGAVTTGLVGFDRAPHGGAAEAGDHRLASAHPNGTVDLAAAKERGVIVANTPDSITGAGRRACDRARRRDHAQGRARPTASCAPASGWRADAAHGHVAHRQDLRHRRRWAGSGAAIARRAEAFGMSVCYHGPRRKDDVPYPYYSDLEEMARRVRLPDGDLPPDCRRPADLDLGARARCARARRAFSSTSRAAPSSTSTRWSPRSKERRIAGAALDVFWDEPRVPEALFPLDNVVLMPHMGNRHARRARGTRAQDCWRTWRRTSRGSQCLIRSRQ